jgi:hypothetical protein
VSETDEIAAIAAEREFLVRLLRLAAGDDGLDPSELEFAVITGGSAAGHWPFEKGDILVLRTGGIREAFGLQRNTDLYDVTEERFGRDWEAARRRSDEVKETRTP